MSDNVGKVEFGIKTSHPSYGTLAFSREELVIQNRCLETV